MRYATCCAVMLLCIGCSSTSPDSSGSSRIPTGKPVALLGQPGSKPSAAALTLLREREGFRRTVYRGVHTGKPTVGTGHLLSAEEARTYPVGTIVPDIVLNAWEAEDTAEAWRVARQQANEIGEPRLTEGLFAVVYQLGIHWHTIHKNTWRLLKENKWREAAREAQDSNWYRQTPLRVRDFQAALRALG